LNNQDTNTPKQPVSWASRTNIKLPGVELIRNYQLRWLMGDLTAGLVICAVTIPASLAYGEMAGLHRINGLYASLVAMLIYGFFGSSRRLIIGAEAAVAILVASSLSGLLPGGGSPEHYAGIVMLQAMLVGVFLVAAGFARIGYIADFFPETVIVGFINGVGLIIIFSQLGNLFGIELKQADFFPRMVEFFSNLAMANALTFIIGMTCVASLLFSHRLFPKAPEPVFMVIIATVAVYFFGLESKGLHGIGQVTAGLPKIALPHLTLAGAAMVLPTSVGVAFITYADIIVTGRAFARKRVHQADPDQELFSLGFANVANGLTQGFTVGASHSRTAVSDMYNGQTQLAGFFGAVFLGLFLLFFTGLLSHVPVVALSAVVVVAGIRLLSPRQVLQIFRKHRATGFVTIATLLSVLLLGIMVGILISVGLTIIILLRNLSRPHETFSRHQALPGLMIYRFGAPLLFFNAPYFALRVQAAIDEADPPVTFFLVNAEAIIEMDWQAADSLRELQDSLRNQNIELGFCEVKGHFREVLKSTRLHTRKDVHIYPSVAAAVRKLKEAQANEEES
jgi:sulfate permease, SulP family